MLFWCRSAWLSVAILAGSASARALALSPARCWTMPANGSEGNSGLHPPSPTQCSFEGTPPVSAARG